MDNNLWGKPFGDKIVTFIQVDTHNGSTLRARMRDEYPEAKVLNPDGSVALARCLWSHHFQVDEETVIQCLREEGYAAL